MSKTSRGSSFDDLLFMCWVPARGREQLLEGLAAASTGKVQASHAQQEEEEGSPQGNAKQARRPQGSGQRGALPPTVPVEVLSPALGHREPNTTGVKPLRAPTSTEVERAPPSRTPGPREQYLPQAPGQALSMQGSPGCAGVRESVSLYVVSDLSFGSWPLPPSSFI